MAWHHRACFEESGQKCSACGRAASPAGVVPARVESPVAVAPRRAATSAPARPSNPLLLLALVLIGLAVFPLVMAPVALVAHLLGAKDGADLGMGAMGAMIVTPLALMAIASHFGGGLK
jgi:hypothetical protein